MSTLLGKKKRRAAPRISRVAEARAYVLLEKLDGIGAFSSDGMLIYPVLERYFFLKCTDYRRYRDPHTGFIVETGCEPNGRPLAAALLGEQTFPITSGSTALPRRCNTLKRWEDTSRFFQAAMILYALRLEGRPHRQLTFHIRERLAYEAKSKGMSLQALMQKLLRERLRRLLGDVEFGLWYRIEQVPFEKDSLHAHGLLYVADDGWLAENSRRNERLRRAIREVSGDDGERYNNWLCIADKQMDSGMIDYAWKGDRNLLRRPLASSPPVELTGDRLESRSHSLSRIGQKFYSRLRPFLNASMSGELIDWDAEQWEAVGITHHEGLAACSPRSC